MLSCYCFLRMEKSTLFGLLAILFYLVSTGLHSLRLLGHNIPGKMSLVVSIVALLLHTVTLYYLVETPLGQNLSAANIACLITWTAILFIAIAMIRLPLENLLLLMQPMALASIAIALAFPHNHTIPTRLFPLEMGHILLSILGNGLLLIAAVQSLLIAFQERLLRLSPGGTLVRVFPPIQVMEKLLFEFIGAGLIVLTLAVVSGLLTWEAHTPYPIWYRLVLSVTAWLVFATLLWGRKHRGWRGPTMVRWTLFGMAILTAAYFGSRFFPHTLP